MVKKSCLSKYNLEIKNWRFGTILYLKICMSLIDCGILVTKKKNIGRGVNFERCFYKYSEAPIMKKD